MVQLTLITVGTLKENYLKEAISEYKKRLFVIGKTITYEKNGTAYVAEVNGINEFCNLCVTTEDGKKDILSSGEISIRL
jgi:biotin-(acetyl-CoA carboxylase) ligase